MATQLSASTPTPFHPPPPAAVARPTPASQAADPRTYQLGQLHKRFGGAARHRFRQVDDSSGGSSTVVSLRVFPSDPDFAFDLDFLEVDISVPAAYPSDRPTIRVGAPGMPRGVCVNVERGWDGLVDEAVGGPNLLWLVNALDRRLEKFLSAKQADMVTLVSFKDTRHLGGDGARAAGEKSDPPEGTYSDDDPKTIIAENKTSRAPTPDDKVPPRPYIPRETFTRAQIQAARAQRAAETKQVESRMSRLVGFARSSDGIIYTLPLQPRRRDLLPAGVRGVLCVNMIVPLLYPLQKLGVQLSGSGVDAALAERVEEVFERRVAAVKARSSESGAIGGVGMTITGWVNYLAQHLGKMAKEAGEEMAKEAEEQEKKKRDDSKGKEAAAGGAKPAAATASDKSHVQVIARPPEWVWVSSESESGSDDYDDSDADSDSDDPAAAESKHTTTTAHRHPPALPAEHATSISFPSISLLGIDLVELTTLAIRVRCDRCRTTADFCDLADLRQRTDSCRKCTRVMAATWRRDLVHAGSSCAGVVELVGCAVAEVLASTYVPQCAGCDGPAGEFVTVPGDKLTNVCRSCHARVTLALPPARFLETAPLSAHAVVPAGPARAPAASDALQQPAVAALKGGSALPQNGVCAHYRRSFRWFRFACCGRVHACDRCHDAAEDHVGERAERMLCGWCSREQRLPSELGAGVDACRFCGRGVVGRASGKTGFWEGGRGTRSKRLMNKNDVRKWKHAGAGAAAAESARKKRGE
jgi:uncharacterized CHY-type Zn-finger protein